MYTGKYWLISIIIQKHRRVCISSQSLIHFAIRFHRETHLSTSINISQITKKKKKKKIHVGRHFTIHYEVKNGVLLRKSSLWWL